MTDGSRSRLWRTGVSMAGLAGPLLLMLFLAAPGRSQTFAPDSAHEVEAVVPVIGNDVNRAHQEALTSAFRRAILRELSLENTAAAGAGPILDRAERYVLGYSIREQTRRDAFYRLKLAVWIDAGLLREEMGRGGAAP